MSETYYLAVKEGTIVGSTESGFLPRVGDSVSLAKMFYDHGFNEDDVRCLGEGTYKVLDVTHEIVTDNYYWRAGTADEAVSNPPTVTINAEGRKISGQELSDFEKMLQESD